MENLEKEIIRKTQESVGKAINDCLGNYNSPLFKLVLSVIQSHEAELKEIIESSFAKTIKSSEFKQAVDSAFTHKVAKILVSKLEGSVEKCVNTLRSDPTTRAKMILAIESIISDPTTLTREF